MIFTKRGSYCQTPWHIIPIPLLQFLHSEENGIYKCPDFILGSYFLSGTVSCCVAKARTGYVRVEPSKISVCEPDCSRLRRGGHEA